MKMLLIIISLISLISPVLAQAPKTPFELMLEATDKNNDGAISEKEFRGPQQVFQGLDLNNDGLITSNEFSVSKLRFKKPKDNSATKSDKPKSPIEFLDKDNDNLVSLKEFSGSQAAFDYIDDNRDGYLTLDEFQLSSTRNRRRGQKNISPAAVNKKSTKLIDTHNHLIAKLHKPKDGKTHDFHGAIDRAISRMDTSEVAKMILMPPPQVLDQSDRYSSDLMSQAASKYRNRFYIAAGGGTINPLLHQLASQDKISGEDKILFKRRAEDLARTGIVAFGEIAALHLSFSADHPFMQIPPDHELMLNLADVAARYSLPIDLHMEAVPLNMSLPSRFSPANNAKQLRENISGLERLLQHNRKAKIVWAHLGWDSLGYRSAKLTKTLLEKHPNLYLSIRIPPRRDRQSRLGTRILQTDGRIKPEWLHLFEAFPTRFTMGSDEFFLSPETGRKKHLSSDSMKESVSLLSKLPDKLHERFAYENPRTIYALP